MIWGKLEIVVIKLVVGFEQKVVLLAAAKHAGLDSDKWCPDFEDFVALDVIMVSSTRDEPS